MTLPSIARRLPSATSWATRSTATRCRRPQAARARSPPWSTLATPAPATSAPCSWPPTPTPPRTRMSRRSPPTTRLFSSPTPRHLWSGGRRPQKSPPPTNFPTRLPRRITVVQDSIVRTPRLPPLRRLRRKSSLWPAGSPLHRTGLVLRRNWHGPAVQIDLPRRGAADVPRHRSPPTTSAACAAPSAPIPPTHRPPAEETREDGEGHGAGHRRGHRRDQGGRRGRRPRRTYPGPASP